MLVSNEHVHTLCPWEVSEAVCQWANRIRTIDTQRTNWTTAPPEAGACSENRGAKAVTSTIGRRGGDVTLLLAT